MPGSSISGELYAPLVRIEHGSDVKVQVLETGRLVASGAVEISGRLKAGEIVLNDGATFSGRLNIPRTKLRISSGASVQFDSILCEGLIVEGKVTLNTALIAETVFVMNGGRLVAPDDPRRPGRSRPRQLPRSPHRKIHATRAYRRRRALARTRPEHRTRLRTQSRSGLTW